MEIKLPPWLGGDNHNKQQSEGRRRKKSGETLICANTGHFDETRGRATCPSPFFSFNSHNIYIFFVFLYFFIVIKNL